MERKIFCLILAIFMTTTLFAMSLVTEMDMYSNEKREEIITKKILKCKDVVDVKVKEHGDEVSKATIQITFSNDRLLVLESYGIHLKLEGISIVKIDEFIPAVFGYSSYIKAGNSSEIRLWIAYLQAVQIKYLDKKLESVNNISALLENFELIYEIFSKLPEAYEYFPKYIYGNTNKSENYYPAWEQMKNPYFYKTETEGGKFYKMTEEAFSKYRAKAYVTAKLLVN